MRRLRIFLFWMFKSRNNVSLSELIHFLFAPLEKTIANRYITSLQNNSGGWVVSFNTIPDVLYWPQECPIEGLYTVTLETFDRHSWHYYQKPHSEIEPGEILLDMGAAEGLFALSVVDTCDKIILVEPNKYFCEALHKTFEMYRAKVAIYNVAVGDTDGEIQFDPSSLSGKVGEGVEKIALRTIDSLLKDENKITYLKADLEGYELNMLRGAEQTIQKHKPKIAITTYHKENNPEEIIKLVKSFVPEYNHTVKGVYEFGGKPVMIHFWL